jgi:hypothetical protein
MTFRSPLFNHLKVSRYVRLLLHRIPVRTHIKPNHSVLFIGFPSGESLPK